MIPNYLKNHSNFDQDDYNHLKNKGYTNREIEGIWNRDEQRQATQKLGDYMKAHY